MTLATTFGNKSEKGSPNRCKKTDNSRVQRRCVFWMALGARVGLKKCFRVLRCPPNRCPFDAFSGGARDTGYSRLWKQFARGGEWLGCIIVLFVFFCFLCLCCCDEQLQQQQQLAATTTTTTTTTRTTAKTRKITTATATATTTTINNDSNKSR